MAMETIENLWEWKDVEGKMLVFKMQMDLISEMPENVKCKIHMAHWQ